MPSTLRAGMGMGRRTDYSGSAPHCCVKYLIWILSVQGIKGLQLPCGTLRRVVCVSGHEAHHAAYELHVNVQGFIRFY